MSEKYIFSQNDFSSKFTEIYFESLEKTKNSIEYQKNLKQIDLYKKILKNNYNVPEDKIEEFVDLIHEQLELEYENSIKNFINNLTKNNSGLF